MTDQPSRTPEEELEHWRTELARAMKASPTLLWPTLIDWAEEDAVWALKAATRSGRARLAGLEDRVNELEAKLAQVTAERDRLGGDLNVYQAEVLRLQDELETAAYDRTWPHDRERPADVQREVDKAVARERRSTITVQNQYRAAAERWRAQREQLLAQIRKENTG